MHIIREEFPLNVNGSPKPTADVFLSLSAVVHVEFQCFPLVDPVGSCGGLPYLLIGKGKVYNYNI